MQISVHPRGPRTVSRDGNLKWSRAKSGPRRVYRSIQYIVMNPSFAYGELFILATRKCKIFHRMNNSTLDFLHTKVATFSVLKNVRFSFVLIIWPDCYYFGIFRPWASRAVASLVSVELPMSNGRSRYYSTNLRRPQFLSLRRSYNTFGPHRTPNTLSPLSLLYKMMTIWGTQLPQLLKR